MKPVKSIEEQLFIEEATNAFTSYFETNQLLAERLGKLDRSNNTINIVKRLAQDTYNSGLKVSAVIDALNKYAASTINEVTPRITNYDELKSQIFLSSQAQSIFKAPLTTEFENAKNTLIDFFKSNEAYAQQVSEKANTHYINFAKSFAKDHSHLSSEDLINKVRNIQAVEEWLRDKNPIDQLAQNPQTRERSNSGPGKKV